MSALDTLAELLPSISVSEPDVADGEAPRWWAERPPSSVVRPGSAEEVAAVMHWATTEDIGVLPCGSGARTRPVPGDGSYVVLSCERLTGVETYEPADLTITAGSGTAFGDLDDALRANAQWAPFDPPFADRRTLGGLVADGASGPLWTGYGELRNHVLGMTVVTGDGRRLRLGGRVVKNVAGYDLLKAMVGSRGRLGVVTSVCLRAFPEPAVEAVLVSTAASVGDLVPLARSVSTAPVLPASVVLADHVEALGDRAALVVRVHGGASTVEADRATLERHVGTRFESVADDARSGLLLELRDRGAEAPARLTASMRPSALRELLEGAERLAPGSITVDAYGVVARIGGESFDRPAVESFASRVGTAGGAVRIDAWPQRTDRPHLPTKYGPNRGAVARLTRHLEEAFDPGGVLWPSR